LVKAEEIITEYALKRKIRLRFSPEIRFVTEKLYFRDSFFMRRAYFEIKAK